MWPWKNNYSIKYPETLVNMWKFSRYETVSDFSEQDWAEAYNSLCTMLAQHFKNSHIPGMEDKDSAKDAASDYLADMFGGACPSTISSHAYLATNAKKFLAQKYNPVQYEMNQILQDALRSLEKTKKIQRDSASKGHRISDRTFFAFPKTPQEQRGSLDDYDRNRSSVPSFSTKVRGKSSEHTRMLTPADAEQLVMALLQAFGGWTRKSDLLKVMKNHIPEQMIIEHIGPSQLDEDGIDPIEKVLAPESEDFIYDFDQMQTVNIAGETTTRIWERICKVSDKVFCLYSLPKFEGEKDVSMEQVGKTSTVGDQNTKISRILQEELQDFRDWDQLTQRESKAKTRTLSVILNALHGRCTASGYDPHRAAGRI